MIECIINGTKTYPSLSDGLKLVIENPAMRDKSSYTYDITFPLSINDNFNFFKAVGLLGVSVKVREYSDCKLIVNNKTLFYGKGIITGVSENDVKMQIIQEVESSIPEDIADEYIDDITYPAVNSRYKQAVFKDGGSSFNDIHGGLMDYTNIKPELENNKFVGEVGKYTFVPAVPGESTGNNPEENLNVLCYTTHNVYPLYRLAVQPNLIYVIEHILSNFGYTYDISSIKVEPWTELYIASSNMSLDICDALPHWKCSKFFEELEKLFNVSFIWSDKTLNVKKIWESEETEMIVISVEDTFERNYDEDGQEYNDTSNITYMLSDTHDPADSLDREVLEKFPVISYSTESEMRSAVAVMASKKRGTSLFANKERPELFYWHESDGDNDTDELRTAGIFRPLFRDITADNKKELNITPVAIESEKIDMIPVLELISLDGESLHWVTTIAAPIPRVLVYKKEKKESLTVQDAIEYDSYEEESEDGIMELMFVNPLNTKPVEINGKIDNIIDFVVSVAFNVLQPATHGYLYKVGEKEASLSLNSGSNYKCLGDMHVSQLQIDNSSGINKHEETILKFIREEIPPIGNIFLIKNKKYVAKQFEVQLNDDGFSKEITGHFYELLS